MAMEKKPRSPKKQSPKQKGGVQEREVVKLPIEWYCPENVIGRFANHLIVVLDKHEYHISFFELPPPIILGDEETVKQQLKDMKSAKATCVARIIVSAERMPSFVKALQDNLNRHQSETINQIKKG